MSQTITILKIVMSSLSLAGSIFIIVIYFKLGMRTNFALKIIMYLTLGDALFSISNLIYIDPGQSPNYIQCYIQAFLIQYSQMVCFIFCFLLCLCIYWTVIKNRNNLHTYGTEFMVLGFVLPFLLAIIPLIGQCYGSQDYICGIAIDENLSQNKTAIKIEAIILFYAPLWLLNIIGIYFIIRVSLFMSKLNASSLSISRKSDQQEVQQQNELYLQGQEIKMSQQITINMLAYPIIMLCCWSGMTVYAIAKLCDKQIQSLEGVRFVMADCLGMCNAIAYGVNTIIILRLQKVIKQQGLVPMIEIRNQSQESDSNRKQFESFLSIATIYNEK